MGIKVLSLFNGMGTLMQAFHNLGYEVDAYYSSEIKPYAIKLQQHHFPNVIQVGDIRNWREWAIDWSTIDFIGSGSPCQDLSAAGKRAGINGSKSSLFFIFVDILNHCKSLNPNVLFLQENVGSANKLDVGIMSRELGVYPCRINSSLLTAQLRDRYYWSNIRTKKTIFDIVTDIPQPVDLGIMLQDILLSDEAISNKHCCITERYVAAYWFKSFNSDKAQGYMYKRHLKVMITLIKNQIGKYRICNQTELERLQGFQDGYTKILQFEQAGSLLGDGWTLPMIEHILSFIKK